jgi:hypothetical protein
MSLMLELIEPAGRRWNLMFLKGTLLTMSFSDYGAAQNPGFLAVC